MSQSKSQKTRAMRKQQQYRDTFEHVSFEKLVTVLDEDFKPRIVKTKAWRAERRMPLRGGMSSLVRQIQRAPLAPLTPEDVVIWRNYNQRSGNTAPISHPQFDCGEVWDLGNEAQRERNWREVQRTQTVWMQQKKRRQAR